MATRLERQAQIPQLWRWATVISVIAAAILAGLLYLFNEEVIARTIWVGASLAVAVVVFYFVYLKGVR